MPLVTVQCVNGHQRDRYIHTWQRLYDEVTRFCACGHPTVVGPSFGTPLLYFSESSARYIWNLDRTIRSHGEHVRAMREAGVEPSTDWHVSRSMSDGLPTKAAPPRAALP